MLIFRCLPLQPQSKSMLLEYKSSLKPRTHSLELLLASSHAEAETPPNRLMNLLRKYPRISMIKFIFIWANNRSGINAHPQDTPLNRTVTTCANLLLHLLKLALRSALPPMRPSGESNVPTAATSQEATLFTGIPQPTTNHHSINSNHLPDGKHQPSRSSNGQPKSVELMLISPTAPDLIKLYICLYFYEIK